MNRFTLTALLVVLATGCSFTTVETARQLDAGEQVYSGSLAWPGWAYLPRVSANALYGIAGVGDASAHVGVTPGTFNFGTGARAYPSDRLILSLQSDAMTVWHDFGFDSPAAQNQFLTTLTPRVMTAVQEGEQWYVGVQTNIFNGLDLDDDGWNIEFQSAAIGPSIGHDELGIEDQFGVQAELFLLPVAVDAAGQFSFFGAGGDGIIPFQFSVGGYFRNPG